MQVINLRQEKQTIDERKLSSWQTKNIKGTKDEDETNKYILNILAKTFTAFIKERKV